jgi:hypothetical protein
VPYPQLLQRVDNLAISGLTTLDVPSRAGGQVVAPAVWGLAVRYFQKLVLCTGATVLSGCASFNSMPDPVLTRPAADALIRPLTIDRAIEGLNYAPDKKAYRNKVIASYLTAADAHYLDFLLHLSRQAKGANFGLEVAALALSSISAIAHSAANELATGAAIATGTRGSLNKEVYFEKTLPAIISAMEARRLTVRAQIELRMKQEDVDTYTLEEGFADIMRYQMATTIDGAIQEITTSAGQQEAEAAERYKGAVAACSPPAGLATTWRTLNRGLRQRNVTREKLTEIATRVNAEPKENNAEQITSIMEAVEQACTADPTNAALALLGD